MSLHFARPSLRRMFWSLIAATVACCVIVSSAYVIGALVTADERDPTSGGEYVRLAVVFLTIWSPLLLLNFWYLSLPVIVTVGTFIASVHPPPTSDSWTP